MPVQEDSGRLPGDLQNAAVVGLDEHADGVAAQLRRQRPRRGSDPPLEAEADGAGSGSDVAFGHRTRGGAPQGLENVGRADRAAADVVQKAVVGFAGHGVDRADVLVARQGQQVPRPRDTAVPTISCWYHDRRRFRPAR